MRSSHRPPDALPLCQYKRRNGPPAPTHGSFPSTALKKLVVCHPHPETPTLSVRRIAVRSSQDCRILYHQALYREKIGALKILQWRTKRTAGKTSFTRRTVPNNLTSSQAHLDWASTTLVNELIEILITLFISLFHRAAPYGFTFKNHGKAIGDVLCTIHVARYRDSRGANNFRIALDELINVIRHDGV